VVEIAGGGLDYANPDMLSDTDNTYGSLGDMLETNDPREALEAAFAVRDRWNEILALEEGGRGKRHARIETGYTGGYTMPFEHYPTDKELRAWAEVEWEGAPKCEQCGKPLPERRDRVSLSFPYEDEGEFCSLYCAEQRYDYLMEAEARYTKELEEEALGQ